MSLCVHHLMLLGNYMLPCQCKFPSHFVFQYMPSSTPASPALLPPGLFLTIRGAGCGWRNPPYPPSLTFKTIAESAQRFCRWLFTPLWDRFCAAEGGLCTSERKRGRKRMNRARCKSSLPLTPAPLISESSTSHPCLIFSFRPSWSSSTPAYGTLLPWGRTMRRPSPVSTFFSHLFSLCSLFHCRFRHTAKPALSPFLFLSLSLYISIYLSSLLSY